MNRVTATSTTTSDKSSSASSNGGVQVPAAHIAEQSINITFTVEVMVDPDTGKPTLCAAVQPDLGDFRETSPARALGLIEDIEALIVKAKRLVRDYEARDTLAAMLDEAGLALEEWPTASLDERIRHQLRAVYFNDEGRPTVVVPQGQDLIERVNAVSTLIGDLQAQAAA